MSPTLRKILTRFSECARFLSLGGEHPARKGHKSRTPERYEILLIVDAASLGRSATMGNARLLMIAPSPRSRFRAVERCTHGCFREANRAASRLTTLAIPSAHT